MSAAIQYGFYFGRGANTWPAETPQDAPQEIYLNPEAQRGLRPSRACAERWFWFKDRRIAELTKFVAKIPAHPTNPPDSHYLGLLASVRRNNPEQIEKYKREYLDAAQWEKSHYGNVAATVRIARIYL